ncbi:MAG TPA: cupin domain-containing protein [Rhodocyclaceae bacterium]|nr:cupin domain-containing protein [Rhodocyclaceae bacterium]
MSGMNLGTVEELPKEYYEQLVSKNTLPLWPALRAVLPYGKPARRTQPIMWRYADVRPDLIRAGELTPIEKAERRVLVLCNPGLGLQNMQATASIYIGLQLIQPGETAPNHKHSPSAVRFVVEGEGGFTVVNGEKLPMEKGDLILTPPGLWHEHGHEGKGPVVWLDALDLPLVYGIDASYCIDGPHPQPITKPDGNCNARFRQGGVMPYRSLDDKSNRYPLLRFPWKDVKQSLAGLASVTAKNELVHLAYINPETGGECLPTLGFSAIMLRPGEEIRLPKRSASAVLHVVEGAGSAHVDDARHNFGEADTLAVPTHADVVLSNASSSAPAYLFMVDDAPLHRKLGIYEVFG